MNKETEDGAEIISLMDRLEIRQATPSDLIKSTEKNIKEDYGDKVAERAEAIREEHKALEDYLNSVKCQWRYITRNQVYHIKYLGKRIIYYPLSHRLRIGKDMVDIAESSALKYIKGLTG